MDVTVIVPTFEAVVLVVVTGEGAMGATFSDGDVVESSGTGVGVAGGIVVGEIVIVSVEAVDTNEAVSTSV